MKKQNVVFALISVMIAFFVMGYVDLVGTAANYVKQDFELSDTLTNLLPSMVFVWFLILSVPTGVMMNKIGRRNTVLLSLLITVVAMIIPMVSYSFVSMIICFALLGIGNTLIQVSINPLLSNIVRGDKLASSITFGQFVKACASFLAPIIASWAAVSLNNWKLLFPIFLGFAIISVAMMWFTKIDESADNEPTKKSGFRESFSLIKDTTILLSFIGILCHVGIDVGINVTAPKILQERLHVDLNIAVYATTVYFIARMAGSFLGGFILSWWSAKKFFLFSVVSMLIGGAGLFVLDSLSGLYFCMALIGLGNANIFPIIASKAMLYMPDKKNEISGLMVMGVSGGALFPPIMGLVSDGMGTQTGAVIVAVIGMLYLALLGFRLTPDKK